MNYAHVSLEDDPDARAKIRQLVEEEKEDELRLDGKVIDAENAVTKPHRRRLLVHGYDIVNPENSCLPTIARIR